MTFAWKRKGLIFDPTNRFDWMHAYAQVPTILELEGRLRVYFTCRPKPDKSGNYVSLISFIEVKKDNPKEILYVHEKPILELGDTGTFDHYGTMPGCILKDKNRLLLYYTGWSREVDLPYTTSIGLAASDDGGLTFQRVGKGPLLAKNLYDPYLVNGPFVIQNDNVFHMWYSSCTHWVRNQNSSDPIYLIKHATSQDGFLWKTEKEPILAASFDDEAQNRPMIFKHDNLYCMCFSYRRGKDFRVTGNGYRLDMAYSSDLIQWRRDKSSILFKDAKESWDNEMQAYPYVFRSDKGLLLFYNGNNFGKNGFGYAELITNCTK